MENTGQNFNLDSFMESQIIVNRTLSRSNQDITKAIEYFSSSLDGIIGNYKKLDNEIQIIKKDNKGLQNEIEETKENYKKLKEVTYVLSTDDGKMKELTKLMQSLAFKYNGIKNSLEYNLFHKRIIKDCYSHLYSVYQVNTYKRISIEDYEEAIKSIKKWFGNKQNIKKSRTKKLNDLRDKIDKDVVKEHEKKLYNKYLEKTGGRV